jgi:putative Mg2+ transporter-C (MgtC) family protein
MLGENLVSHYWSTTTLGVNLVIFANIFGALLLGLIVGYERTYHGRAAGMRTYGLVCMAACALTVFTGYPQYWYGGLPSDLQGVTAHPDPTRVIQGIVSGIGFLGAGLIMRDGLSISGLTTAASLWASSAIGILVGVGFYPAAILLTALSGGLMMWASRIERLLPARPAISITLTFVPGFVPLRDTIKRIAADHGYDVASGSFHVRYTEGRHIWRYVAIEINGLRHAPLSVLAENMAKVEGIEAFDIGHARN